MEGQITPGFYLRTFSGADTGKNPYLPHWPWPPQAGNTGDLFVFLSAADPSTFGEDPIPQAVMDLLRVQTWRFAASYVDPNYDPPTNPIDLSRTLTTQDVAAGSMPITDAGVDEITNEPGWASIEEAINLKQNDATGGLGELIGGVDRVEESTSVPGLGSTPVQWATGLNIHPPILRFNDLDELEWVLPLSGFDVTVSVGGVLNSTAGQLTALGELLGDAVDPGWTVTLEVLNYFA
jgi:hypothetical protein